MFMKKLLTHTIAHRLHIVKNNFIEVKYLYSTKVQKYYLKLKKYILDYKTL